MHDVSLCVYSKLRIFFFMFKLQAKHGQRNADIHTAEMLKGERLVPER